MRKFENGQANVWASYYNSKVIALYKDGKLFTTVNNKGKKEIVPYYFEDEEIPTGYETKTLLFEEFVCEVINNGKCYLGHTVNYKDEWIWHTDAYPSFTKTALDDFLREYKDKEDVTKPYDFLFEEKGL